MPMIYGCGKGRIHRNVQPLPAEPEKKPVGGTKICHRCGRELPLRDFSLLARNADGLDHQCRECRSERRKKAKSCGR